MEADPLATTAVPAPLFRHAPLHRPLLRPGLRRTHRLRPVLLAAALLAAATATAPARAQSTLLDSVKQNPQRAKALCTELKTLNAQGLSYTSPQAVAQVAAREGLSATDAEILSTYVVGLYCPDVR
ncbi:MAG: hypothetical protein ACO3EF_03795 [Vulcanococcus sp.]